jgi:hypothetical protein
MSVSPPTSRSLIGDWERQLFDSVEDCPQWKTVNVAREVLRRELLGVSKWQASQLQDVPAQVEDLPSEPARQIAVARLASLGSRAVGSVVVQIACGYLPESKAGLRRLKEGVFRARAIVDDESGHHARAWLLGRPVGSLAHLESRYGKPRFLKDFSVAAHADVAGLDPLMDRDHPELVVNLAPQRDDAVAEMLFTLVTIDILLLIAVLLMSHPQYMLSMDTGEQLGDLQNQLGVNLFKSADSLYVEVSDAEYVELPSEVAAKLWSQRLRSTLG